MLDYAALFVDRASAAALALDALQRAVRDMRMAPDADQPPVHHPFLLVERTARVWSGTARRSELTTEFLAWLDRTTHTASGPFATEPGGVGACRILRAYQQLPRRTQAVLWHAVAQWDDAFTVGRSLGVHPDTVPRLGRSALEDFRQAFLRLYAEQCDGYCRCFVSLLEAATRRRGAYPSVELDQHMAACVACSHAHSVLTGMNERPGTVLAEGLLPWGGAAFAAVRRQRRIAKASSAAPSEPTRNAVRRTRPHREAASRLPWLRQLADKCPALTVMAAAGLFAAGAATACLPKACDGTGASGPAAGSPTRTVPHVTVPRHPALHPSAPPRTTPSDTSHATGRGSAPSDDNDHAVPDRRPGFPGACHRTWK
ncbi:hypothetical protein AB0D11_35670 [Streptomyces monashensis]|uniref:hypothetical protein n=1 Tax=Streptomyces monashensis TaxID=1678012 RepID=UPI003409229B